MKKIKIIISAVLVIVFVSCNKTKKYSKRIDGNEWTVVELSVDGVNETNIPIIEFDKCNIYKESCKGEWKNNNGGEAHMAWQFRENGTLFEISNQSDHIHKTEDIEAINQCIKFSGIYEVLENKKKNMAFKSSSLHGFPGKTVVMKLEKK